MPENNAGRNDDEVNDGIGSDELADSGLTALRERLSEELRQRPTQARPFRDRARREGALSLVLLLLGSAVTLAFDPIYGVPILPLGFWRLIIAMGYLAEAGKSDRRHADALRMASIGTPVTALVIRADDALYRPGTTPRPCRIALCFDVEAQDDREWLRYVAGRWSQEQGRSARKLRPGRYVPVPHRLTDGMDVRIMDILLAPTVLRAGYLERNTLPCLVDPDGRADDIVVLPYWLVFPFFTRATH